MPNSTCVELRLGYRLSAAVGLTNTEGAFIWHVVWTSFFPNPQEAMLNEILKNSPLLTQNFNTASVILPYSTAARPSTHTKSLKLPQDPPVTGMWLLIHSPRIPCHVAGLWCWAFFSEHFLLLKKPVNTCLVLEKHWEQLSQQLFHMRTEFVSAVFILHFSK